MRARQRAVVLLLVACACLGSLTALGRVAQDDARPDQCVRLSVSRVVDLVLRTRFTLWADVWRVWTGSSWQISDVEEWVSLTGITAPWELAETWHYHRISPDRQSVTIRGGGTLDYYFIVKYTFKLWSSTVGGSITYDVRK